ncbi:unnamed protein product [Fraxinus pennsylvanica]|uniref:SHSP domain-containing protein n=1 Tax=Fraxinus pennsylvanica TaxID=56036 RepID=A0AAD2DWN7_9LAMI|nr:unnamed protein product [Fraxinus pennsylvanica]
MSTPRHRRGGGTTPYRSPMGGVRPIYEDFKPPSEWSQDNDTYILTIQVPGFMKEQLKVSTEDRNLIRVRGERPVANKWSRFREDFQVPDNSELTSIRAKHDGGTLAITVPKKNIAAGITLAKETLSPLPKAKDQVRPPKTTGMKSPRDTALDQHGQDKVSPAIGSSKPITDDRSSAPAPGIQKTSGDDPRMKIGRQEDEEKSRIEKEKSPELTKKHSAEENIVDEATKKIVDDKSLELGKRTSDDHQSTRTGQQEDEQKSYIEKKGIQETKERRITPETALLKDHVGIGKEITEDHGKIKSERISKKHHDQIAKSSATDNSPDHGTLKVEQKKYKKKARKGIGELNDERQLLVNMGAALLVIVGLSAYVAYNFGSQNAKH